MKLQLIFFIYTILFSFYINLQSCPVVNAETVSKNSMPETSYAASSEDPFVISALIPHWE